MFPMITDWENIYTDNTYWSNNAPMPNFGIYAEADIARHVGNNANRFFNCNTRSCVKAGIYITDGIGEGSFTLVGGTAEGNGEKAIHIVGLTMPFSIRDVHCEGAGNDIIIEGCALGLIQSVYCSEWVKISNCSIINILSSYLSGVESDAKSDVVLDSIVYGAKGLNVTKGTMRNITNNFGGASFPALPGNGLNTVLGDLETWKNSLPTGFGSYDTGMITKSDKAKFGDISAKVESRGANAGLLVTWDGDKYKDGLKQRVTLSAWMYTEKAMKVHIYLRYRGGVDYFKVIAFDLPEKQWKRCISSIELDIRASQCSFIFGLYRLPSGESVFVDGIEIAPGEQPSAIYDSTMDLKR